MLLRLIEDGKPEIFQPQIYIYFDKSESTYLSFLSGRQTSLHPRSSLPPSLPERLGSAGTYSRIRRYGSRRGRRITSGCFIDPEKHVFARLFTTLFSDSSYPFYTRCIQSLFRRKPHNRALDRKQDSSGSW